MACCDECARGGESCGESCGAKPAGEAIAHPLVQRARTITGAHSIGTRVAPSGDAASDAAAEERFLALVERAPESERATLVREHLRARGASEEAIRGGVTSLIGGGLDALRGYLRNELETNVENIRANASVTRENVRQRGETERAQIAAEQARLDRESRERTAAGGGGLPAPQASQRPGAGWVLPVGGIVLAVIAAWALTREGRR